MLLMLGLTLTGCSTTSPAPIQAIPKPAALSTPESDSLQTYSKRARAWLKKAADTLEN